MPNLKDQQYQEGLINKTTVAQVLKECIEEFSGALIEEIEQGLSFDVQPVDNREMGVQVAAFRARLPGIDRSLYVEISTLDEEESRDPNMIFKGAVFHTMEMFCTAYEKKWLEPLGNVARVCYICMTNPPNQKEKEIEKIHCLTVHAEGNQELEEEYDLMRTYIISLPERKTY